MYLDELIEEVARATRVLANRKSVTIDVAVVEGAAFTGDEDLIRRLLGNLLDNAVRYAPSDSTVAVSLRSLNSHYEIVVSDRGSGVPVEAQTHIFERFYRSETARGRTPSDPGGAGLGLAIAQWIARLHGGDVALVSSSHSGSTFRVELPFHTATVVEPSVVVA
jgi:two-component system sensor histidine kinase SenX3